MDAHQLHPVRQNQIEIEKGCPKRILRRTLLDFYVMRY